MVATIGSTIQVCTSTEWVCPVCGGYEVIWDERGSERLVAGDYVNDQTEVAICASDLTDMVSVNPVETVEIPF